MDVTEEPLNLTRVPNPSWDAYFLLIASAVSTRGNCKRRRIGAVIVDDDHRVVEVACNGAPDGHPQCMDGGCPRGNKSLEEQPAYAPYDDCVAVHAEARAIMQGDFSRVKGSTMYVTTSPCPDCMKLINGAAISRLVTPTYSLQMIVVES